MPSNSRAKSAYGHTKDQLNVRVSDEAHAIIRELAAFHGLTQAGVIEMVMRDVARDRGFNVAKLVRHYQSSREVDRR